MTDDGVSPDAGRGDLEARLDRMLARGRVTRDEAARVRAATDDGERQAALAAIRLRHASERAEQAVAEGRVSRADADAALARLAAGGDASAIRRLLAGSHGRVGDAPSKREQQ